MVLHPSNHSTVLEAALLSCIHYFFQVASKQKDLKKKLKVSFVGEPGLDMGGLTKEWFLLLIRQIFHPDYGMFVYHPHSRCYWFSTDQEGNLREYNLIGVLMGLAVYNSIILDLHFPSICYRKLLSPPVVPDVDTADVGSVRMPTVDDLAEIMPVSGKMLLHCSCCCLGSRC
jgi:Ubiquitin-protein ligase